MLSPVLNSGVIVPALAADMNRRARDLMSVFMSAFAATGATKAELRAVATAAGVSAATFHRSLNELVDAGLLANEGIDDRPRYRAGDAA
jgi:DNA-binding IclR family transcriptional regulator